MQGLEVITVETGLASVPSTCYDVCMTTNPNPTTKTRKPRQKKWASEVARQAHSNARRRLAREASLREEQTLNRARNEIAVAEQRLATIELNRRANMIANGLYPRLTAVMSSWGLNLKVKLSAGAKVGGWTDFRMINVTYDNRLTARLTEAAEKSTYHRTARRVDDILPLSVEELRQVAAEARGVFYHELGHNLFTVPLKELLTLAWQAGVEFQPGRGGAAFSYAEWSALQPETRAEPGWDVSPTFQRAWNILEDQGEEQALVIESPHIASYLTVVVVRLVIKNQLEQAWPLVAGRTYLPQGLRDIVRRAWRGSHSADEYEAVISEYCATADPVEMLRCVARLEAMMSHEDGGVGRGGLDNHNPLGNERRDPEDRDTETLERRSETISKGQDAPQGDESSVPVPGEGDEAGDDQEAPEDGESTDTVSETPGNGVGTGHREDGWLPSQTLRDRLNEEYEDVLQDLADDETVTADVQSMNTAYEVDEGRLPFYSDHGPLQREDLVSQARAVVDDIVRAFQTATSDCAPQWVSCERTGVLESIRYRTRQPGDMEFFRRYSDEGEPGQDISVSVFCDVSGSMGSHVETLGAAAWACKVACQQLNVECDVTLFDDGAWKLWGTEDVADAVPTVMAHGGTDPSSAFSAILHEERPQKHHLVLVMTDGMWNDVEALRRYRKTNSYLMAFNFSAYHSGTTPDPAAATRLGFDEAYNIQDLMALPLALESMLLSVV